MTILRICTTYIEIEHYYNVIETTLRIMNKHYYAMI